MAVYWTKNENFLNIIYKKVFIKYQGHASIPALSLPPRMPFFRGWNALLDERHVSIHKHITCTVGYTQWCR